MGNEQEESIENANGGPSPISVSQQRRNRKRQQSFNKLAILGGVAIGGAVAGAGMGAGAGAGTGAGTGTGAGAIAGAIAVAIAVAIATGASLISSSLGGGGVALAASGWTTTTCSAPLVGSLACKRAVQCQRMAVAPGVWLAVPHPAPRGGAPRAAEQEQVMAKPRNFESDNSPQRH